MLHMIVAPYESGAQLAYLSKTSQIDLVISDNPSVLIFGVDHWVFKLNNNSQGYYLDRTRLASAAICQLNPFTFDRFVQMCILSGCEFFSSLKGIRIKTVRKLMSTFGNVNKIICHLNPTNPNDYYSDLQKVFLFYKYCPVVCPTSRRVCFLNQIPEYRPNMSGIVCDVLNSQNSLINGFDLECFLTLDNNKRNLIFEHEYPEHVFLKAFCFKINIISLKAYEELYCHYFSVQNNIDKSKYARVLKSINWQKKPSKIMTKFLKTSKKNYSFPAKNCDANLVDSSFIGMDVLDVLNFDQNSKLGREQSEKKYANTPEQIKQNKIELSTINMKKTMKNWSFYWN